MLSAVILDPDLCHRALLARDVRFDGRFFTGVRTTGVYCRPVCPARTPRRENCRFFPSAAAAEGAGFRACLRCRPETAPELGAWRGTSNTVARALALIEAGALDDGDVEALGDRLGVGGRQLRRLFKQHLGASPVGVAQTRRVLLAKQLIHETDLPMTAVALASGFGSVRRFNETFQQLYGRPPGALRRRTAAPAPATRPLTVRLRYRPPYDWEALFDYLKPRALPGVERVEGDRYARTLVVGGHAGSVTVQPVGGDQVAVGVRFPSVSVLPQVLARVRRVFDLAADPAVIGEHLSRDPAMARLAAARPGLRVPGAWDGFEAAVRTIVGQQITVTQAVRIVSGLAERYGEPLPEAWAADGLSRTFPSPAALAAADLAHLPMPRARSRALESLAAAVAADPAVLAPAPSLEDAVRRLRALPGVGEWTAQYVALRELREPDAFPASDVALLRAAADGAGVRPTPAELLARAEAWRPWRAYAAVHLWTSLDGGPALNEPAHDPRSADRAAA